MHSMALTSLLPAMAKREPTTKLNMRNQRGRARDVSVDQRINLAPFLMSRVRKLRNLTQSLFPADLLFVSIPPVWFLCSTSIARAPSERERERGRRRVGVKREYARREESKAKEPRERERERECGKRRRETKETTNRGG